MVWCTDAVSELAQLGGEGKGNSIMRLICSSSSYLTTIYVSVSCLQYVYISLK